MWKTLLADREFRQRLRHRLETTLFHRSITDEEWQKLNTLPNDATRFTWLRLHVPQSPTTDLERQQRARQLMTPVIRDLPPTPSQFVDIGCDEGDLTAVLKTHWPESEVVGVDVRRSALERAQARYPQCKFQWMDRTTMQLEGVVVAPDAVFVCSMSLHHMTPDQRQRLYAQMRGHRLWVREHDCANGQWKDWLDMVHGLYALSMSDPPEDGSFLETGVAQLHYQSRRGWMKEWCQAGWSSVVEFAHHPPSVHDRNPTNAFWVCLQKSHGETTFSGEFTRAKRETTRTCGSGVHLRFGDGGDQCSESDGGHVGCDG